VSKALGEIDGESTVLMLAAWIEHGLDVGEQ
jgi:hypothetical protein